MGSILNVNDWATPPLGKRSINLDINSAISWSLNLQFIAKLISRLISFSVSGIDASRERAVANVNCNGDRCQP